MTTYSRHVQTRARSELVEITGVVRECLAASQVGHGVCMVYCPHTTAGLTINENADPDVRRDVVHALDRLIPWDDSGYRHREGNSAAHVKASLMGFTLSVPVHEARLSMGTWQGIYLCEFDGPRRRRIEVSIQG